MNPVREFMYQAILAVLQSALIVGGSLSTAALMKACGYPDAHQFWHPLALFVRHWGFLLLSIPLIWAGATMWLERSRVTEFSIRSTVATGLLVLAELGFLMFFSALLASGAGTLVQTIK